MASDSGRKVFSLKILICKYITEDYVPTYMTEKWTTGYKTHPIIYLFSWCDHKWQTRVANYSIFWV